MSTLLQRAAQAAKNGDAPDVSRETLTRVPIDDVADNPYQNRTLYLNLDELAASIAEKGILQPPIARRTADGIIQLAFGHRRLRGGKLAGLTEFPVFLRPLTDQEMSKFAWSENKDRSDTSAIEDARHIQQSMAAFGWTQAQAAAEFGIARSTAANLLRLLTLPEPVQALVDERKLDQRHARSLLALADAPEDLTTLAATAVEQSLSAREVEGKAAAQRKIIDAEREKQRQIAAVDALGLSVPWIEMRGKDTSYFRPGSNWADAALLENGQCGPGVCDCLRFHCLSPQDAAFYDKAAFAYPCYDDAPAVVYACCQDQRSRQKSAQVRQSTADTAEKERREAEEEKARREAEEEKARRDVVAAKLIDSILARWPLDALWMDARFWRFAAEHVRYELSSCIDAGANLAEMQMNILRACIIVKAHERGLGYVIDLGETSKNRQRLFSALGDKSTQPAPGDSQATNWQEGWDEEDEREYQFLMYGDADDPDWSDSPNAITRIRVVLRYIEDAPDKMTRGYLWKRYNELLTQD